MRHQPAAVGRDGNGVVAARVEVNHPAVADAIRVQVHVHGDVAGAGQGYGRVADVAVVDEHIAVSPQLQAERAADVAATQGNVVQHQQVAATAGVQVDVAAGGNHAIGGHVAQVAHGDVADRVADGSQGQGGGLVVKLDAAAAGVAGVQSCYQVLSYQRLSGCGHGGQEPGVDLGVLRLDDVAGGIEQYRRRLVGADEGGRVVARIARIDRREYQCRRGRSGAAARRGIDRDAASGLRDVGTGEVDAGSDGRNRGDHAIHQCHAYGAARGGIASVAGQHHADRSRKQAFAIQGHHGRRSTAGVRKGQQAIGQVAWRGTGRGRNRQRIAGLDARAKELQAVFIGAGAAPLRDDGDVAAAQGRDHAALVGLGRGLGTWYAQLDAGGIGA